MGKMEETAKELATYEWDVTVLQEIIWRESGERKIKKKQLLVSIQWGVKKREKWGRILCEKKNLVNIIEFTPVNDRIAL